MLQGISAKNPVEESFKYIYFFSLPNLANSVCGPHGVSVGYLKEVGLIKGNSAANG